MSADLKKIGKDVMVFDGSIGFYLTSIVGKIKGPLELLNITEHEKVVAMHRAYVDAGADFVTTNTFGANRLLLFRHGLGYRVEDFNRAGVVAARKGAGGKALVAGSIGPTGKLMEPFGDVRFEEIFDALSEQVKYMSLEGVDVFIIETMSDFGELRAAMMACREVSPDTPVIANLTFSENGRTIWGTDFLTFISSTLPHGPLALGANCGLGPKMMLPVIEDLCRESPIPVIANPNAGLPRISQGRTVFPMGPDEMTEYSVKFADAGCSLIGSCCGSTPKHTAAIAKAVKGRKVIPHFEALRSRPVVNLTSAGQTVRIGSGYPVVPIGERINPTGKRMLTEELETGIFTRVIKEARSQSLAGARMLDVNISVAGNSETWLMRHAVREVQKVVALPMSIDSVSVNAIEAGLKAYVGRPLINSVTAEQPKMEHLLRMAKRFGAALIALCLDGSGIPATPEARLSIAKVILNAAEKIGLSRDDLVFDPLTLTIGSDSASANVTLETMRLLKSELGVNTIIGLSNISHGMPQRSLINAAFLSMAAEAGLDSVIINPENKVVMGFLYAVNVLTGKEPKAARILKKLASEGQTLDMVDEAASKAGTSKVKQKAVLEVVASDGISMLTKYVMEGDADAGAKLVRELIAEGNDPDELLDKALLPAMERVSEMFRSSDFFLPEALLSSEAFKACLGEIKKHQKKKARATKGKVVLATVHGDIHDIGKNLVKMVLSNAGYNVLDLGANVPTSDIVEAAKDSDVDIVALSALMTTTMSEMGRVVEELRTCGVGCEVIVGGAVLTPKYAEKIGASAYGSDAMEGLRIADKIMRSRKRRKDEN